MSDSTKDNADNDFAELAKKWEGGKFTKEGWRSAPEALPSYSGTIPITLRIPSQALQLVREIARRKGMGYQVLLKQWIDDRLRNEFESWISAQRTIKFRSTRIFRQAAALTFRSPESVGNLEAE